MLNAITLYGIPNCNTVKKARDWLEKNNIDYEFHDFKKHGTTKNLLENWLTQMPHDKLINRAGLTWRGLDEQTKAGVNDNNTIAINLMLTKTSVIKRPVLVKDSKILCLGFDEATYEALLK